MSNELPVGWASVSFGEYCRRFKRLNEAGADLEPLSVTKDDGIVLQSEKFNKRIATDTSKYKIIRRGEFAYDPMSLYYGAIGQLDCIDEGVVSPAYITFDTDEQVEKEWFRQLIQSELALRAFDANTEGGNLHGKRKKTNWNAFSSINLPTPPLDEQKWIAMILFSVDEAIEATRAVIEQTRRVKEGLRQDLLKRGVGHDRLKTTEIGNIPETWELRHLGDLMESLDSQRVPIKASERKKMQGNVPYYGASGVIDWINKALFNEELLLVAEDGANLLDRTSPIAFVVSGPSWVNNHAHVFRTRGEILHDFAAHSIENLNLEPWVTGSAQPKLNGRAAKKLPIPVPPLQEQRKICDILRSVASDIKRNQETAICLQQIKAGLLQDLLTGKVRVKT